MRHIYIRLLLLIAAPIFSADTAKDPSFMLFLHGLGGSVERLTTRKCYDGLLLPGMPTYGVDGPDSIPEGIAQAIAPQKINEMRGLQKIRYNLYRLGVILPALRKACLAQDEDIARNVALLNKEHLISDNGICLGHSKGAALAANLLCTRKFKGAVLLTPFYHGNLAFRDHPPFSAFPRDSQFCNGCITPFFRSLMVPNYRPNGIQPCDLAMTELNKDTPILIGSITDDSQVPQYHQYALYIRLKEAKFSQVYLYEIAGEHDALASLDPQLHAKLSTDLQNFESDVLNGKAVRLAGCQPTAGEITDKMREKFGLTMDMIDAQIKASDWSKSMLPGTIRSAAICSSMVIAWKILAPLLR